MRYFLALLFLPFTLAAQNVTNIQVGQRFSVGTNVSNVISGGGGSSLLMDYFFNGNLNDSSGNGNNLSTLAGSITYTTGQDGLANHAAVYDGSSYAGLTDATIANFTIQDFSISTWVFITGQSASGDGQIVDKGQFGSGGYEVRLHDQFGNHHYQIRFFMYTAGGVVECNTALGLLVENTWYSVVVTRSGTTGHVYVNGADVTNSGSAGSPVSDTSDAFWVGENNSLGAMQFIGNMDEIRVYTKELSSTEAFAIYTNGAQ